LDDDADAIAKKFKRAVTDSGTEIRFSDERPAINNLLTIYQLATGKSPDECEAQFEGKGYGQLKSELADAVIDFLAPFRQRMEELDDATLRKILDRGAENARSIASKTMEDVHTKVGLSR
jgi:tryptophanyl-tRNA synthetase